MVVCVDDIMIIGSKQAEIDAVKQHLHKIFGIKDLENLHYFFGLEVSYIPEGNILSLKKFTNYLLTDSKLNYSKIATTPLPFNC